MRKIKSDSSIELPKSSLFDIAQDRGIRNRKSTENKTQCPVIQETIKPSLPKPVYSETVSETEPETVPETVPETMPEIVSEPIKPKPTGFTPMMNRVIKISLDDDDALDLKKWTKVYNESESKLRAYQMH